MGNCVLKCYAMDDNNGFDLAVEDTSLSYLKRNLADYLTVSRAIIGFIILSLGIVGKNAYPVVVVLTLIGAATDLLDGKVARHYFGEHGEGRLGKHDLEIDTLFVLCVLGYCSFAGIVVPKVLGLGWISLVLIAAVLFRKSTRILVLSEIPTVIALLVISLLYNIQVFALIVMPAMVVGIVVNRRRVMYLIFDYWPGVFMK